MKRNHSLKTPLLLKTNTSSLITSLKVIFSQKETSGLFTNIFYYIVLSTSSNEGLDHQGFRVQCHTILIISLITSNSSNTNEYNIK